MNVDLTTKEIEILRSLVEQRLAELGPEIHHTATAAYRESLRELRKQLLSMLRRLSAAA